MKRVPIDCAESRKNRILIVGNGFDLDLGFDTTYKTFCNVHFNNSVIIDNHSNSGLFRFLKKRYNKHENWFNLEDEMRNYVLQLKFICPSTVKNDLSYYSILNRNMHFWMTTLGYITEYDEREEYRQDNFSNLNVDVNPHQIKIPNRDSIAYDILKHIGKNESYFNQIISFNYTKLENILRCTLGEIFGFVQPQFDIKIEQLLPVQYIHCNLQNNKVILGIEQEVWKKRHYKVKIPRSFNFLQKYNQFSSLTERQHMIDTIVAADELVIFGHSLGTADADYFRPLFEDMFAEKPSHERKITFITYKDNRELLKQIEYYAGGKNIVPHHSFKNLSFLYTSVEESRMAYSNLLNNMS